MQQLDVLEAFARTERAAPTYCLYNFVDAATDSEHWHCCNPTFQPEQLGCTVIPSSVVRTAIRRHGGKTFDRIHRERVTRPWRCLACQNVLPLQENAPVHSGRMEGAVGPTSDAPLVKAYLTNDNRHEALPDGLRMLLSEEKMSEQRLSSIYRSLYGPAPAIPRRVAVFDVGVKAS